MFEKRFQFYKKFRNPDAFDPAESSRTFKLSLNDISEGRVLPILMDKVHKLAPKVSLSSYYTRRDDLQHALAANEICFAVDPFPPSDSEIKKELIFEDEFVVVFEKIMSLLKRKIYQLNSILS